MHDLAQRTISDFRNACICSMVGVGSGAETHRQLEARRAQQARELHALPGGPPRTTRFGSVEATRACVAAGLGLALLPRVSVGQALADGRLAVVDGPPVPDVPVLLARHRARWASPAENAVTEALTRGMR